MRWILLSLGLALAGCAHGELKFAQSEPCPGDSGGWCEPTQAYARATWAYAQLSNNAYAPEENAPVLRARQGHYVLPQGWVERDRKGNDASGFAYAIFDRFEGQRLAETVIAYRGTEILSGRDWLIGNVLGAQNRRGWAVAKGVRKSLDDKQLHDTKLVVTGHSLGGGIAQYVSLRNVGGKQPAKVSKSIVFDNSPRYWRPFKPVDGVERIAVAERGEALAAIRWTRPKVGGQKSLTLNCQRGFNAFKGHKIVPLANCLTWIAAFKDPAACDSIRRNPEIGRPETQVPPDVPECPRTGETSARP